MRHCTVSVQIADGGGVGWKRAGVVGCGGTRSQAACEHASQRDPVDVDWDRNDDLDSTCAAAAADAAAAVCVASGLR